MKNRTSITTRKRLVQGKKLTPKRKDKKLRTNHMKALEDALTQLCQTPVKSLFTSIVIAVALLLATTLFFTLKALRQVTDYLNTSSQVTVYMKAAIPNDLLNNWLTDLKKDLHVEKVTYISPKAALEELAGQADYQTILTTVTENPLPPVVLIKLKTVDNIQIEQFINQLKKVPWVASIHVDFDWLKRLASLIKFGKRISYPLVIFFGSGALLIISHAIQEATLRNRQEMLILQLMGASVAYIRRPFLYLGTLLGLGAGVLALLLLSLLLLPLRQPLAELLTSYSLPPPLYLINFNVTLLVLTFSIILGWLGAWLAFYKYAKIS